MLVRLQKYLASAGVASRRAAENLILEGRISVNGKTIQVLGTKVDDSKDIVCLDKKEISTSAKFEYIMLNKPKGYVCTNKDQFNRKTIFDLVKGINTRLFSIGRLDYDTKGLIILTNDGELSYKLTHPKHSIPKTYIAEIKGVPTKKELLQFKNGLLIDNDYVTAPSEIEICNTSNSRAISLVKITIKEGKNRQVRKMCDAINHEVVSLKRIAIGNVCLGELEEGNFRKLNEFEIKSLHLV